MSSQKFTLPAKYKHENKNLGAITECRAIFEAM